jgi:hypothetical protein
MHAWHWFTFAVSWRERSEGEYQLIMSVCLSVCSKARYSTAQQDIAKHSTAQHFDPFIHVFVLS